MLVFTLNRCWRPHQQQFITFPGSWWGHQLRFSVILFPRCWHSHLSRCWCPHQQHFTHFSRQFVRTPTVVFGYIVSPLLMFSPKPLLVSPPTTFYPLFQDSWWGHQLWLFSLPVVGVPTNNSLSRFQAVGGDTNCGCLAYPLLVSPPTTVYHVSRLLVRTPTADIRFLFHLPFQYPTRKTFLQFDLHS